jgi:tetratricopeptide (TPR) repeat protein
VRAITDNPYPGSRAFTCADQALFFGRGRSISTGVSRWKSDRLTIVSGPPGCGKTSLLHAGLYPQLRESARRPFILPPGNLTNGLAFPVPALPRRNPFTVALLRSWAPDDIPTRLAGLGVSEWLRDRTRGHEGVIYAAIDAMDDLILGPRANDAWGKWRQDFLAELAQAIDDLPRLHLLLVTRVEALDLLTATVGTSTAGDGARQAITGLSPTGAFDAITRPARLAGRIISEDAANGLIAELSTGDHVDPALLQAACSRLWAALPSGTGEIPDEAVSGFGRADAVLADWCGQVIGEVAALHRVPPPDIAARLTSQDPPAPDAISADLLDRHLLTREDGAYRLASGRLTEPLRMASTAGGPPTTAAAYLRAGELALARGELALARTQAERAQVLRPERKLRDTAGFRERAEAESLLGNVACRGSEPERALPHYRKASELMQAAGDSRAAAYQLAAVGQILLTGKAPGDAIPYLSAAADRERNDLWLQIQLAGALWRTGDGRGAVVILNSVLDREGGHAEARRIRGEILADLGDGREAILDLDHAALRRSDSGVPSSRAALGLALAETGDHAAAARVIKDALEGARHSGPVLLYAARASDLAGDMAAAKERAREAIDATDPPLSPPHKRVALALAGHGFRRGTTAT